jgi:E3 ubiquitin-protein ligase RFWD3
MRQTVGPVNSLRGLTGNPVHTVHSLLHSSTLASGVRSILSASSIGLCQWNFGGAEEG